MQKFKLIGVGIALASLMGCVTEREYYSSYPATYVEVEHRYDYPRRHYPRVEIERRAPNIERRIIRPYPRHDYPPVPHVEVERRGAPNFPPVPHVEVERRGAPNFPPAPRPRVEIEHKRSQDFPPGKRPGADIGQRGNGKIIG